MHKQDTESRPKRLVAGETILLYFILWMDLFVPILSFRPFSTFWILATAFKNLVRVAAMYALIARPRGAGALGLSVPVRLPRGRDLAWALAVAAIAAALMVGFSLIGRAFGAANPLFVSAPRTANSLSFFFGLAATSLTVGYSEELFFRFFAQKNLESAGFSPAVSVAATSIVFGLSHSAQGVLGIVEAFLLGLVFSLFRLKGKSIHALAIGHALYDFGVMVALLSGAAW